MIIEQNIPDNLDHAGQFESTINRLNAKKSLIQTVVGAEDVEEAVNTSALRPIVALVWKDEINPNPKKPKSLLGNCSQLEYRDWLAILVTEQVGGVVEGIRAKDEVVSILENWRPCKSVTPFIKINALFSHNHEQYACSVYSLRFRSWYTNQRIYDE